MVTKFYLSTSPDKNSETARVKGRKIFPMPRNMQIISTMKTMLARRRKLTNKNTRLPRMLFCFLPKTRKWPTARKNLDIYKSLTRIAKKRLFRFQLRNILFCTSPYLNRICPTSASVSPGCMELVNIFSIAMVLDCSPTLTAQPSRLG